MNPELRRLWLSLLAPGHVVWILPFNGAPNHVEGVVVGVGSTLVPTSDGLTEGSKAAPIVEVAPHLSGSATRWRFGADDGRAFVRDPETGRRALFVVNERIEPAPGMGPFELPIAGVGMVARVQRLLAAISFAPSCLDMGWSWEVVGSAIGDKPGVAIRCSFRRPDTRTGEIGTGYGRWWAIEADATGSAVVKTAWLACKQIIDHELMEAFLVASTRPFDPHASIGHLIDNAPRGL